MVSAFALISNLLLASLVLASPSRLEERLARRAGRQSRPLQRVESVHPLSTNTSNVEFSSNWAGAVFDSLPAGTFKSVTSTFTVPTPTGSSGAASAWVGIDGDTCGTAILQTGVDFTISNGRVTYDAWHEWFPASAVDFSGIPISAGNVIKLTVTASTTKSGTAVIENVTTGKTVTQTFASMPALCLENAEWIVEDFEEGNSLVPFANFGTVTFTGASATTVSGTTMGPSGTTLLDIQQNGVTLTSVSSTSNSVTVSHV